MIYQSSFVCRKDTMMNFAVTQQDALEVASVFMNTRNVIGVELVGSIARNGMGNDLDLVLTVNPFRYATFVRTMQISMTEGGASEAYEEEEDEYFFGFKSARLYAALEVLNLPPALSAWLEYATRSFTLDLFLMPQGWRKHIEEVQAHLPHRDPRFVRNIAADAVTLKRCKLDGGGFRASL
jgi:hypothetical protein